MLEKSNEFWVWFQKPQFCPALWWNSNVVPAVLLLPLVEWFYYIVKHEKRRKCFHDSGAYEKLWICL